MNSIQDVWEGVLNVLSRTLTSTSINTFFNDCEPIDLSDGTLIIYVPNAYKAAVLQKNFADKVKDALKEYFSRDYELRVLNTEELEEYKQDQVIKEAAEHSLPEMDGYTFDDFIVGASNKFAYGAAQSVVKDPGNRFANPLLIYGNSGLGKTHLLCAIGTAVHEKLPKAKIVYIKGEDFTNQMIRSIKENTANEFRKKCRSVDLLLMDDIEFIAGKEATQEEFFHTFNSIYEAGHQIVIASDRPPIDMARLDERLRTRFEGGIMADIQPPDLETRIAIIRSKAKLRCMDIPDEIVSCIAQKDTANVRQIEGILNRLVAMRDVTGGRITAELVDKVVSDVVRISPYVPTPDDIINEVARFFKVTADEIKGPSRQSNIKTARHVAAYLIRVLTNLTLPAIGDVINRDYTTVLAAIRKTEAQIKTDKKFAGAIRDITSNINARKE